jgi:hypothetical protein
VTLLGVSLMLALPLLAIAAIAWRQRVKGRARDKYLEDVREELRAAGFEPLGDGVFRRRGRHYKVEAGTNPLLARGFTVRLASWSNTIHEFELRRGAAVPPEFAAFAPLLATWASAGKMYTECYVAGVRSDTAFADDLAALDGVTAVPLSKPCRGGTFTIREGFEKDCPQWHWRHDQRRRLFKEAHRACVSYWQGDPYLNPGLLRLFEELAGGRRLFYLSDVEDLAFLERAFDRRDIACWGALLELRKPELAIAADLHTDGAFLGGLFAADDLPPGFEDSRMPRRRYHDEAVKILNRVRFYVRRLMDNENSWYGGEYEILSYQPLDVRAAVEKVAREFGGQVMELDRRFHKRLVRPLDF